MSQLIDLTDVTDIDVTVREALSLGVNAPPEMSGQRAIVAATSAIYGIARAYQAIAEEAHDHIRVFESMDEAPSLAGTRLSLQQPFRSMGFVSVIIVSGLFALGLPLVLL